MSPRFLPKIVWYQRVWRPSPSHLSQRGSRWQLRGRRQVMGFSLLLKIIMPLQGHTHGYDTTFSSSPSGVRTAAAHTVWHAKTRRGLVALLPSHPWTVALVSRREGIFVFPVTGQRTQEGANCSQGKKKKKKKHTSQMSLSDCHELPKITSLFFLLWGGNVTRVPTFF